MVKNLIEDEILIKADSLKFVGICFLLLIINIKNKTLDYKS